MEERDTVHRVRPERLRLQPMNTSYLLKVSTNFLTESVTKFVTNPIVLTNMLTKNTVNTVKLHHDNERRPSDLMKT